MNQFRTHAQVMAWRQQLAIRVQSPTENVTQYSDDVRTLLKKIDPENVYPEDYRVRKFIKGLNPSVTFFLIEKIQIL